MLPQRSQPMLEVRHVGTVAVARLTGAELLNEEEIDVLGEQLLDLVERGEARRLVISFRPVVRLASHMLGELLNLQKKVLAAGGSLALCDLNPQLAEVFASLKLGRVFCLYANEDEAMACCAR